LLVDRCNFDGQQRSHWIKIARESGGDCCVTAVCLDVSTAECCGRVATRSGQEGHETLTGSRSHTDDVVQRVAAQLTTPDARREGFDRVVWIEQPEELLAELYALVAEPLETEAPRGMSPPAPASSAAAFQPSETAARESSSALEGTLEEEIVFVPDRDAAITSSEVPMAWECLACTFLNKNAGAPVCEVCQTERPARAQ